MTYQPPQQTPYYPPVPPIPPAPPVQAGPAPRRGIGAIVGALVAGILLGAGGTIGVQAARGDGQEQGAQAPAAATGPDLKAVMNACGEGDGTLQGRKVVDDGRTIILEATTDVAFDRALCVLEKLGASSSVTQHVKDTRALDGQQTESWSGLSARWTYHPDAGLNLTITKS